MQIKMKCLLFDHGTISTKTNLSCGLQMLLYQRLCFRILLEFKYLVIVVQVSGIFRFIIELTARCLFFAFSFFTGHNHIDCSSYKLHFVSSIRTRTGSFDWLQPMKNSIVNKLLHACTWPTGEISF